MRGKGYAGVVFLIDERITPAHAGKRCVMMIGGFYEKDHPRACGEKQSANRLPFPMSGSPPRMRGKDERRPGQNGQAGITPAHAGKSKGG